MQQNSHASYQDSRFSSKYMTTTEYPVAIVPEEPTVQGSQQRVLT
jgi:hypothetical protein